MGLFLTSSYVQQILGRYKLNNIGLASVSCLHNWAGEKGQQDWSVGCLDSRAGNTERGVRPRHSEGEVKHADHYRSLLPTLTCCEETQSLKLITGC